MRLLAAGRLRHAGRTAPGRRRCRSRSAPPPRAPAIASAGLPRAARWPRASPAEHACVMKVDSGYAVRRAAISACASAPGRPGRTRPPARNAAPSPARRASDVDPADRARMCRRRCRAAIERSVHARCARVTRRRAAQPARQRHVVGAVIEHRRLAQAALERRRLCLRPRRDRTRAACPCAQVSCCAAAGRRPATSPIW